jgi:hypothetical protein
MMVTLPQVELGIGPMGHRAALLDAVAALAQEAVELGGWVWGWSQPPPDACLRFC